MNIPNRLTLIRMALVPIFIACFYIPYELNHHIAALVFILAYLTDIIDGRYARKHNLVTDFGKLMDPMADKLLTGSATIMLTGFSMISPITAVIIIGREFIISAFRLVCVGKGNVIAANNLGKLKTITQCVAIVLILLENPGFCYIGIPFDKIVMLAALVFTVWSAVDYIVKNKKYIDMNK